MQDGPAGGNCVLVYFTCRDCAVEAQRASAAGGQIVREKMSIGQYGFIALIRDTEGNMIGLHSMQ
jgi:predicted enzyme related to lactoylglutathione lyase